MFIYIVIPATILSGIIALLLMKASRIHAKIDSNTNRYILRYDAIHRMLGVMIGFELPIVILIFLFPIFDLVGVLIFTPFMLVAIYQGVRMVGESYWYRLELGEDTVIERDFFRRSSTILWSQVENITYEDRVLRIRDRDGKTIKVCRWIVGFPNLLDAIRKKVPTQPGESSVK